MLLLLVLWRLSRGAIVRHLDLLEHIDDTEVALQFILAEHRFQTRALQRFNEIEKLIRQVLHILLLDSHRAFSQARIPRELPVRYLVRCVNRYSCQQRRSVLQKGRI